MRTLHVLKNYPCGGGMETVANLHLKRGEAIMSISMSSQAPQSDNIISVGSEPWKRIYKIKEQVDQFLETQIGGFDCTFFYNGYGVEWLGDNPKFGKKYLYLHTDFPRLGNWIQRTLRFVDGYVTVNQAIVSKIRKKIPYLPLNRFHVLSYPVKIPDSIWLSRRNNKKIIIGYSGRIQWRQKRLERIVRFKEALDKNGLDYQFEFLGDGPAKEQLVDYFKDDPHWIFHGHLKDQDYWEVLSRWKYQVFFSDYEGLPISLLEGVAAGAVPLYPKIFESDDWVESLNSKLIYPFGDPESIPSIINNVEKWDREDWKQFWEGSEQLLRPHFGDGYEASYESFLKGLNTYPHRKKVYPSSYPAWFPLWLYHRVQHKFQFGTFTPPKFKLNT